MSVTSTTSSPSIAWNGPVCNQCRALYVGHHQCSSEDIMRRVRELLALIPGTQAPCMPQDVTSGCPCRPENGGSGVCGCTLGGPKVTC